MNEDILKVQSAAQTAIFREPTESIALVDSSFLEKISKTTIDVLRAALGKTLAQRLNRFVSVVDFGHPGLLDIAGGALVTKNDFVATTLDIIALADYAIKQKLSISSKIHNIIREGLRDQEYKDIHTKIDSPLLTHNMVRLLPTRIERDKLRSTKKVQSLRLEKKTRDLQELWDLLPCTFMNFVRFNNVYENDIREAKENADCFADMGVTSLVSATSNDVEKLESQAKNHYYGFNNISMTQAAIIQAKLLGYQLIPGMGGVGTRINVPKSIFSKYVFWEAKHDRPFFNYVPHCYAYHELADVVPDKIKQIVDRVESFPDVGGRAIFDHFKVLVPSVDYPTKGYTTASYVNENGKTVHADIDVVSLALDKILIRKGFSIPILLGEKDAQTYFICYWSE